jgi:Ca-activated chloride channel family protein
MDETQRRPVIPQVRPDERFPDRVLVELRFPGTREVVDRILFQYLDEQRVPSHAVFVLDVSGSMQGKRIAELQRALLNLAGQDRSITGQFARFRGRERVTFIPFNSRPIEIENFEVRNTDIAGPEMTAIRDYVSDLHADGGTAIFSSLQHAYEQVAGFRAQAPDRYYSIVVMSDGQNNEGETLNDFLRFYAQLPEPLRHVKTFPILFGEADGFFAQLPEPLRHVKTFPILFGEADVGSMERVAEVTGGRVFDAKKHPLSQIFKQIRGYQ